MNTRKSLVTAAALTAGLLLASCSNTDSSPATTADTTVTTVSAPSSTVTPTTEAPTTTTEPSAVSRYDATFSAGDAALINEAAPVVDRFLYDLWVKPATDPFTYLYGDAWAPIVYGPTGNDLVRGPADVELTAPASETSAGQLIDIRGALWIVSNLSGLRNDEGLDHSWRLLAGRSYRTADVQTVQYLNSSILNDPPTVQAGDEPRVLWPVLVEFTATYKEKTYTIQRHYVLELVKSGGVFQVAGENRREASGLSIITDPAKRAIIDGKVVKAPQTERTR